MSPTDVRRAVLDMAKAMGAEVIRRVKRE